MLEGEKADATRRHRDLEHALDTLEGGYARAHNPSPAPLHCRRLLSPTFSPCPVFWALFEALLRSPVSNSRSPTSLPPTAGAHSFNDRLAASEQAQRAATHVNAVLEETLRAVGEEAAAARKQVGQGAAWGRGWHTLSVTPIFHFSHYYCFCPLTRLALSHSHTSLSPDALPPSASQVAALDDEKQQHLERIAFLEEHLASNSDVFGATMDSAHVLTETAKKAVQEKIEADARARAAEKALRDAHAQVRPYCLFPTSLPRLSPPPLARTRPGVSLRLRCDSVSCTGVIVAPRPSVPRTHHHLPLPRLSLSLSLSLPGHDVPGVGAHHLSPLPIPLSPASLSRCPCTTRSRCTGSGSTRRWRK